MVTAAVVFSVFTFHSRPKISSLTLEFPVNFVSVFCLLLVFKKIMLFDFSLKITETQLKQFKVLMFTVMIVINKILSFLFLNFYHSYF